MRQLRKMAREAVRAGKLQIRLIDDQQRTSGEFAGDAHDRLLVEQISARVVRGAQEHELDVRRAVLEHGAFIERDRKSTRLNSSHLVISYAVFCLKKKKKHITRVDYVETY